MSALLRAAGLPRHTLRLKDTDVALRDTALAILGDRLGPEQLSITVYNLVARASASKGKVPAHRALADAMGERDIWLRLRDAALSHRAALPSG